MKTLLGLALALAIGPSLAHADYIKTDCSSLNVSPCSDFVQALHVPPIHAAPLTQESFHTFYDPYFANGINGGPPPDGQYVWFSEGSNASYEYGFVMAGTGTTYVNGPDGIFCCLIDSPWNITGINAAGTIIGTDGMFPFLGNIAGPPTGPGPVFPLLVNEPSTVLFGATFIGISDDDSILGAYQGGPYFVLTAPPSPVPSPASMPILATGIILLLMMGRRCKVFVLAFGRG